MPTAKPARADSNWTGADFRALMPLDARNDHVVDLFNMAPDLHALAIIDDGRPVALINRRAFMDQYALPYHRELFGKRPCLPVRPIRRLVVERYATLEQVAHMLANDDLRYLSDGLVITDAGRYVGLATGERLVRAVTEIRLEAARYANPLTFLPGNVPINSHVERLKSITASTSLRVTSISTTSSPSTITTVIGKATKCSRRRRLPTLGLRTSVRFSRPHRRRRLPDAVSKRGLAQPQPPGHYPLQRRRQAFISPEDRLAGGIYSEDRSRRRLFFGFVTMSIGAVRVAAGTARISEEIGAVAAVANSRQEGKKRHGHDRFRAYHRSV